MPVARLFQREIMHVDLAAGVERGPSGKRDDMDLPIAGHLRADPGLPLHQLVSEFADIRPGHQDAP